MPELMNVGMYYNNRDVRLEEMPIPEIGSKELLLEVKASGICGSDVLEWYRIKKAPLVLGHEVAGVVSKVGKEVIKYKEGDKVFVTHHVPCNTCDYCLNDHHTACETLHKTKFYPGGFAQYLRVPEINVDRGMLSLPDEVSYEQGSFIEPLGTVMRGARKVDIKPGDSVLVLGSGIAGLLHVKMAKALGAGNIIATDINPYRLDAAKNFGADYVINAKEDISEIVKELNNGTLANKVIISTGALPATKQGLASVDRGGTVLFFAVPNPRETVDIDFNHFWRDDISIMTSYASAPNDSAIALEMIRSKRVKVKDMITHKLKLEEIAEGFRLASEGDNCLKVIIEPNK